MRMRVWYKQIDELTDEVSYFYITGDDKENKIITYNLVVFDRTNSEPYVYLESEILSYSEFWSQEQNSVTNEIRKVDIIAECFAEGN
jgi:hypothetical protein